MSELGLIVLGALLVNNFVLAQFLGLCPFMGITRSYETAYATGLATTFVLSFASVCAHIVYHSILLPLELEYLRIIVFIVIIAGVIQLIDYRIRKSTSSLNEILGKYLPLIASNCVLLGVTLVTNNQNVSLLETLGFSIGAACFFTLIMTLFGALNEQIVEDDVPAPFRGTPITLISAGIMSLAFMGLQGIFP